MNEDLREKLFTAVKAGDVGRVKSALLAGAKVDVKDEYKETPLIYAAQDESVEMVALLLENGAKIEFRGEDRWTPLRYAVERQRDEIAEFLIASDADASAVDARGETVLYGAVSKRNLKIAKLLIDNGAEVNAVARGNGTAIKRAVFNPEDLEMVKLLVESGADLTFDPVGIMSTAVQSAATYGGTEIVRYLFAAGIPKVFTYSDGSRFVDLLEKFSAEKPGTAEVVALLKAEEAKKED